MRVITYNIHGWKRADGTPNLEALAAALRDEQPDLVGLNEVFYPQPVAGSAGKAALEWLAAALGLYWHFGPCLRWPAQNDMPAKAYGNALLSRWPIIAGAAHHLTSKEEDPAGLLARFEERGLLEGRILLPDGRTFTAYVTHLDHTSEEARAIQLRIARTWLGRDRNRPHLVMGDFNAVSNWDYAQRPEERAAVAAHAVAGHLFPEPKGAVVIDQMEKAGYVDLGKAHGTPGERTFLGSTAPLRIDYLFASKSLAPSVHSYRIITAADAVSDHRPVAVELTLPPVHQSTNPPVQ